MLQTKFAHSTLGLLNGYRLRSRYCLAFGWQRYVHNIFRAHVARMDNFIQWVCVLAKHAGIDGVFTRVLKE